MAIYNPALPPRIKRRSLWDEAQQSFAVTGRTPPRALMTEAMYAENLADRATEIERGRLIPAIEDARIGRELEGKRLALYSEAIEAEKKAKESQAYGELAKTGVDIFGRAGGFDWAGQKLGLTKPAITPESEVASIVTKPTVATPTITTPSPPPYLTPPSGAVTPATTPALTTTGTQLTTQGLGTVGTEVGSSARLATLAKTSTGAKAGTSAISGLGTVASGVLGVVGLGYGGYQNIKSSEAGTMTDTSRIMSVAQMALAGASVGSIIPIVGTGIGAGVGAGVGLITSYWDNLFG